MKTKTITILLLFICNISIWAQKDSSSDSIFALKSKNLSQKHPWKAAWQTFGINTGIWAFDRYILQEDFAKISFNTIKENIKTGFVWDNDQFSTNLFAHPYHGNLYYNTARSNGMTFWESAPYALGGSLMWEIVAENEPPSINDLIATTVGGIALGEFTYRMSSLVLNDSKRGIPRFISELLGTVISPIRGLNRMINGDMWKVKHTNYKYHDYDKIPVRMYISSGNRYLASHAQLFDGEHNPYLKLHTIYGDPFNQETNLPYDYLTASITLGMSPNQPFISHINLMGRLWSRQLTNKSQSKMMIGIFQHFNYYDSKEVKDGSGIIPYKISEAASVGPGIIYKHNNLLPQMNLQQEVYLSGILLGGGLTDHYKVIDRNYNLGSGYSIKSYSELELGRLARIYLHADFYHLFTWKGYDKKGLQTNNPLYYNTQGDKGNTIFLILTPSCDIAFAKHWKCSMDIAYYFRRTHYAYYKDVHSKTVETRLGITYEF